MAKRLSVILFLFSIGCATALARSSAQSLSIDVKLTREGSAHIEEIWGIDVENDISEWYLVCQNLGKIEILNFGVEENGKEFENVAWGIDLNKTLKTGRCGIINKGDNNYELCWGIGEEGHHSFRVHYTMTNFVKRLNDACAFNHMFVARDLDNIPSVDIRIHSDSIMTLGNTRMWAFGHRGGKIGIDETEGSVVEHIDNFRTSEAVIIMLRFEPNMFEPTNVVDEDFQEMLDRAMSGAEFNDKDELDWLDKADIWLRKTFGETIGGIISSILTLIMLIFICIGALSFLLPQFFAYALYYVFLLPLWWILKRIWNIVSLKPLRYYLKRRKYTHDIDWVRDIPFDGSIAKSAKILNSLTYTQKKDYTNAISAYILRLIYAGAVSVVERVNPQKRVKERYLTFLPFDESEFLGTSPEGKNQKDNEIAIGLYKILRAASGEDMTLQPKELSKWIKVKENQTTVNKWYKRLDSPFDLKYIPVGDVRQLFGLKKFLQDFTLIGQRHAVEINLWNEYLVFATLFGIADQVARDFRKVTPEYFQLSKRANLVTDFNGMSLHETMMAYEMSRTLSRAVRYNSVHSFANSVDSIITSSGGGGFSSFGGGGGFSGGGSGGGGR